MNLTSATSENKARCVADALGLGSLSDGEAGLDPEMLQELYRHARGEDGKRVLFDNDTSFAKGWVNLDGPRAKELITTFVPLDDVENLKQARRMAQANLEAQPWNDLLGIDDPPIVCKIKIHGIRWGLRFQSAEPAMRGREVVNEDLPPIGPVHQATENNSNESTDDRLESAGNSIETGNVPAHNTGDGGSAPADDAVIGDILRQGGMPR